MKSTSGQAKPTQGGNEEQKITLSKRDVIDLELVRRRVQGSTYEDGEGQLFTILYARDRGAILELLEGVLSRLEK